MSFLYRNIPLGRYRVPVPVLLWFLLTLIAALAQLSRHSYNNYLIYKGVFTHLRAQTNLYGPYPAEYFDANHYGPSFGPLIAPFALLPDTLGVLLWCLANAALLFRAIGLLPVERRARLFILAFCAVELMTAIHNVQFNPMLAGFLILAFAGVERQREAVAPFPMAAGFLIKLYGIGGSLFFLFSKNKLRYIAGFLFWGLVLFALPMLFSSPAFVLQSYSDWLQSLMTKNAKNADFLASNGMQDISVMGMIRRMSGQAVSNLAVLAPAALLILAPLLRFRQYAALHYRLSYLAIVLISVVIFSSSAESSTYIIALPGVALWYLLNRERHPRAALALLLLTFVLTSLSPTDLFPKPLRESYVRPYSLKCLPVFLVWCWLIVQVSFRNFRSEKSKDLAA